MECITKCYAHSEATRKECLVTSNYAPVDSALFVLAFTPKPSKQRCGVVPRFCWRSNGRVDALQFSAFYWSKPEGGGPWQGGTCNLSHTFPASIMTHSARNGKIKKEAPDVSVLDVHVGPTKYHGE